MRTPSVLGALFAAGLLACAAPADAPLAWQTNPQLGAAWEQLAGRFIYEVACIECHKWGPAHWPRARWDDYLKAFPDNHQPDVRKKYSDLAAMMDVGRKMPNAGQQHDALTAFILATAPKSDAPAAERERKFSGFPEVGRRAPAFSITDVAGREHSLVALRDRRALVLVFSRAHW